MSDSKTIWAFTMGALLLSGALAACGDGGGKGPSADTDGDAGAQTGDGDVAGDGDTPGDGDAGGDGDTEGDGDAQGDGDDAGDGDVEPATVGTAAFGAPVVGGNVRARCAGLEQEVTGQTGADGAFELELPDAAFPCALEVTGGNLPADFGALHSFATGRGRANITPLTDLALALAVQGATGHSLADWFAAPSAFEAVDTALADAVDTLRSGLSAAGYTLPTGWTAGSLAPFTESFAADPASDPYDQLLEQLGDALEGSDTYADYAALLAAFAAGEELPEATDAQPDDRVPASVHASLAKTYTLVFHAGAGAGCGSVCSYTEGQSVELTVHADSSLSIGQKTLTAPFHRKLGETVFDTEIIWADGNLEYALSDNSTGLFNEINVGDASQPMNGFPKFLGQLRAESSGNAAITQFAGQYQKTHQYMGETAAWTSLTIGADGSLTFGGGAGPNISAASVASATDRMGCCGRVDIDLNFDLNGDGAVDSSDSVNLYASAEGGLNAVEYAGAKDTTVGVRLDTSALPEHDGSEPPDTAGIAATAVPAAGGSSVALDLPLDPGGHANADFHALVISASAVETNVLQQQLTIRLEAASALAAGQTFDCYEGTQVTRITVKTASANTATYSSQYGGRCQIHLTAVEVNPENTSQFSLVEGTFTGELFPFKRNSGKVTVSDGVFRYSP